MPLRLSQDPTFIGGGEASREKGELKSLSLRQEGCYHYARSAIIDGVKQIITRVDDDLALRLKERASRSGESVNSYVNRLLRVAVVGSEGPRQIWKAAAIASGLLVGGRPRSTRLQRKSFEFTTTTKGDAPAEYVKTLLIESRGTR